MSRFLIAISILAGIIALGHLAVYAMLATLLGWQGAALWWLRAGFGVLAVSFIATSVATAYAYSTIGSWFYTAAAVWLGTGWLLFLSSVVFAIVLLAGNALGAPTPVLHGIGWGLAGVALLASAWGTAHSFRTQITSYTVALPGLPAPWVGQRIAVVSDTHFGAVRGIRSAQRIAGIIAAQQPAAVLIAGDFYDGPPAPYAQLAEPFGRIPTTHGVFFATGNHEAIRSAPPTYTQPLQQAGIRVLTDEAVDIDGLRIIGAAYETNLTSADLAATLQRLVVPGTPSILIKHIPVDLATVEQAGVSLQVSGHTHRGQVWPGPLITGRIYGAFAYGLQRLGQLQVLTSSGAGTWGPPQRLGSRSEVVVITLQAA